MYYYSTVNEIVLTHSAIEEREDIDIVTVRFERPSKSGNGFDFAEGKIPYFTFQKTYGFSEEELFKLKKYLKNNAVLIWDFAGKGGGLNA